MKKEHLFFDFDGMTFDTLPSTLEFINQYYNTDIQMHEIIGHGSKLELVIQKHTGDMSITRDEFYRLYGEKYLPSIELHKNVQPMKNAQKIVNLLNQKYVLHTVTVRQITGHGVISHLIDRHLDGSIKNIHCVWRKDENGNFTEITKKDYIKNIDGYKVAFFDDSQHEVDDMHGVLPSFLFDPNNHYPEVSQKNKITDWVQIGDMYL